MVTPAPVVVVGAGVSGLHAAGLLASQGQRCLVLESRARIGGRACSVPACDAVPDAMVDLGPSWFWPDAQPEISALVRALGVPVFVQPASGAMRVERFRLEAPQSFVPDAGTVPDAMRFSGGAASLALALAARLPSDAIRCNARVTGVAQDGDGVMVSLASGEIVAARAVILALPPRVIAQTITFDPAPSDAVRALLLATPTWMAPHAKVVAVYETPFWRADGYSGMASSFVGPLHEVHDASPPDGVGALFGFVGIGAGARAAIGEAALRERAVAQLVRLFGPRAGTPLAVHIKDWATDADTATTDDLQPSAQPHGPGGTALWSAHWGGRLVLAGAEVAQEHPGYLEGAVRAAVRAVSLVGPA